MAVGAPAGSIAAFVRRIVRGAGEGGKRIQPFRIEDEAKQLPNTNVIVAQRFAAFAVRDGRLITGQQQYSGGAAAKLVIKALGV